MDWNLYFAFVAATALLMLIPGPNVALIVANSVARGTRIGLLTVLGTSCAMVPQLVLTLLGMSTVLGVLANWFEWLRWIGVAYLVYLGVKQWRAQPIDIPAISAVQQPARSVFARGFFVSLTNPKTLLFYSAFFPQFVNPERDASAQLVVLSATFLALALMLDSTWAVLAGRARPFLVMRAKLRNRVSGALLIGAGLGLALARKK